MNDLVRQTYATHIFYKNNNDSKLFCAGLLYGIAKDQKDLSLFCKLHSRVNKHAKFPNHQ